MGLRGRRVVSPVGPTPPETNPLVFLGTRWSALRDDGPAGSLWTSGFTGYWSGEPSDHNKSPWAFWGAGSLICRAWRPKGRPAPCGELNYGGPVGAPRKPWAPRENGRRCAPNESGVGRRAIQRNRVPRRRDSTAPADAATVAVPGPIRRNYVATAAKCCRLGGRDRNGRGRARAILYLLGNVTPPLRPQENSTEIEN